MTPAGSDDGTARDRSEPEADAGVLAVVVTAGNTPFLAETLSGLASQTRCAEIVLVVDVASRANGLGDGTPIEEVVEACGLDARSAVRIVRAGEVSTFGGAVASGLAAYTDLVASGGRRRGRPGGGRDVPEGSRFSAGSALGPAADPVVGALSAVTRQERRLIVPDPEEQQSRRLWLWLLHDDSAPQDGCLSALLAAAANARSVGVVGPKQVSWDHPDQLLEVGLSTTASARRDNTIVPGEVDQGQYDDRSDVLAVGTAGALVARAVWDEVGGIAPWLGPFGDGLELSRAVRLRGYRVVVEPQAVLRHRRASYLGLRPDRQSARREGAVPVTDLPDPDPERSFRERRVAQLTNWGAFSSRPLVLLLGWFMLLGLARGLWRLVSKVPALARDEVAAASEVLGHAGRVRSGRRRLSHRAQVPRSALGRLYVPAAQIRAARRDQVRQERERSARSRAPSELEVRELAALARTRRRVLTALVLPVLVVTAAGLSSVVLTRSVSGGASAFLTTSWRELWEAAWSAWIPSGDGYPGGPTPLLGVLALPIALGSLVGVDGDTGIHVLLLAAVPLAALGAWFAAGTVTRRVGLRWAAGLVWALTPNLLAAVGQGRLTAVLVHLALPWMLLAVARALGTDRRDVVVSGLVGAHLLTDRELQELDRFSRERVEDLAHLDQDSRAEKDLQPAVVSVPDSGPAQDGREQEGAHGSEDVWEDSKEGDRDGESPQGDEDGTVHRELDDQDLEGSGSDAVRSDTVGTVRGVADLSSRQAPTPVRYGPGSAAAAAAAGLLASVVVAASAATAPLLLLVIGVLALRSSRGYRLLLTLVPLVLTAAPAWWRAWQVGSATTWPQGLRLLLTDVGAPTAVGSPSGVDLLLGSPTDLDLILADGALSLVGKILLAVVPAAALASLLVSGRRGAGARTGLLLALGGLALAVVSSRTVTAVGTSLGEGANVVVAGWAGAGLSVALAGFVLAGLVAGDACLALLGGDAVPGAGVRGWRSWAVGALCLVVAAGPLTASAAWAWQARTGSEQAVALSAAGQQVPLIAAQLQSSGTQGRVLHLAASPEGLQVSTWRHPGTQLTDVLPEVLSAQLRARVPGVSHDGLVAAGGVLPDDVPMVLGDDADLALADLVARAVSGQDERAAADLAAHGIAVVVLAEAPGDELAAETRSGLASTPGLDQLAQTASGAAWRVAPQQGQEASRLTVVDADGLSVPLSSDGGEVAARAHLPRGQDGRTLVLAERASSSWSASLDGTPLEPTTLPRGDGEWRQAFVLPADEGILEVTYRGGVVPTLLTYGIWSAWVVTAVAALPLRRGKETV